MRRSIRASVVTDGKYVAFVSNRGDYAGIYRKLSSGRGQEELLYRHTAGTPGVVLTDWSADGRFMVFHAGDVLYVLSLDGPRQPVESHAMSSVQWAADSLRTVNTSRISPIDRVGTRRTSAACPRRRATTQ